MARTSANVALVEDDASVRKAIVRLLTVAGFQTIAFDSAEAFLDSSDKAKQQGCVVIDINLPGLSGFELQERMCATASLPVVFITAHDEPSVRARYQQSGAIAYLVKPFPADELITAVRKALDGPESGEIKPAQPQTGASPLVPGEKQKSKLP
jgi:FixJ family two-component response regulator